MTSAGPLLEGIYYLSFQLGVAKSPHRKVMQQHILKVWKITLSNNTLFGIFEYMAIANGSSEILTGYFSQFRITLKSGERTATFENLPVLR